MNKHYVFAILSAVLLLATMYGTFVYAPTEAVMGAIQRVFYVHVGTAMAAYVALGGLLVYGILYLVNEDESADCGAEALAGVAFVLCSIVMVSGMIWGHSAWNTWWRWEPRLTSFLVLWLMLFGLQLLRWFSTEVEKTAAVYGILCAINVPIVMLSVKFIDLSQQLHPEVSGRQGFGHPAFLHVFVLAIVSCIVFSYWVYSVNLLLVKNKRLARKLNESI